MVAFHFGAWEYMPGVFAGLQNVPVSIGTGRQQEAGLDRALTRLRSKKGIRVIHNVSDLLQSMAVPGVTGFMLDNTRAGRRTRVARDSFSISVPNTAYRLAGRSGIGVFPLFARLEGGRVVVDVYPPGDESSAVRALLAEVRKRPEEWVFWAKAGAIEPIAEAA